jgi:hypothetical protein
MRELIEPSRLAIWKAKAIQSVAGLAAATAVYLLTYGWLPDLYRRFFAWLLN